MDKNTTTILVSVAVLILLGGGIWWWTQNHDVNLVSNTQTNSAADNAYNSSNTSNGSNSTGGTSQNQAGAKGNMYFTLADAALDMGTISSINMTIDKVQMADDNNNWITVSDSPQTFDLLALKAKSQSKLLGKVSVPVSTYDRFKIHISKVMVTSSGTAKEAKLPGGDFTVNTKVDVHSNTDSTVQFDVLADKSLHQTGSGEFVFTPVVAFNSRANATVKVDSANVVTVSFGQTNAVVNSGMDVDGSVKTDFMVAPNAKLDITGGAVKVNGVINLLK